MEGHFSIEEWQRLDDPAAARLLMDPNARKYLLPYTGEGRVASEAARIAGVRLDTMLYRVRQLLKLGLLREAAPEERRGRPVKRYRIASSGFVVPYDAMQAETLLELFRQQDQPERERLGRGLTRAVAGEGGGWNVRVYHGDKGRWNFEAAPDDRPDWKQEQLLEPHSPAVWYSYVPVQLTESEAKTVQHTLAALFAQFANRPAQADTRAHTLQLGLAPYVSEPEA